MLNRKDRKKIKELRAQTEAASSQLNEQKPKVTAITAWLERRKDQNGFGLDWEYTLRPRGNR